MAQIQSPETYADGQQVTAARLNNQTNGAILLPGVITDQTAITANTVQSVDSVLLYDSSASSLRKATVGDITSSGSPVVTGSVTAVAGADLVVTPAATFKLDVAGPLEADSLNITGNSTIVGNESVTGTLTVGGLVTFNATSAVKIPVGTTAERPATSVAGQFRYNTTLDTAEVYSGTEWKAAGGIPFDATGGNTITTVDGYKIHTFTTSGTFTPVLTREGKVEVLVVGGGGGGSQAGGGNAILGGGGGGGAVASGFLTISKNSAPIAVTVGGGGGAYGGVGGSSSFSSFTAAGGGGASGSTGGTSGSGFTSSQYSGSNGGGGATSSGYSVAVDGKYYGGGGGAGVGSRISGAFATYGGGGGGGGANYPGFSQWSAANGGAMGYAGGVAVANRGGGGGGGGGSGPSGGAAGVVIIRYRVS